MPGRRADGHDFAAEAVGDGAVALVVERPLDLAVPQLVVRDARAAMAPSRRTSSSAHPSRELEVVGVTGTNGKTTTAFLLYAILAAAGRRPGLLGTIERRVGGERRPAVRTTPEAIDLQRAFREMLDAGDRSCALEATSHGSELGRLDRVRFAALVFTNLTPGPPRLPRDDGALLRGEAAALHASARPPAARQRRRRVRAAARRGAAGRASCSRSGSRTTPTCGRTARARPAGARFRAGGLELETRLRGRFNVENVLGARRRRAAARHRRRARSRAGVEAVRGVPGRFEAVDEGQPFAVLVDYAHKPDALENVLATARELGAAAA